MQSAKSNTYLQTADTKVDKLGREQVKFDNIIAKMNKNMSTM